MVLNEEEAKVVRRIYGLFLQGHSPYALTYKGCQKSAAVI